METSEMKKLLWMFVVANLACGLLYAQQAQQGTKAISQSKDSVAIKTKNLPKGVGAVGKEVPSTTKDSVNGAQPHGKLKKSKFPY
jgi:hypothetical protein